MIGSVKTLLAAIQENDDLRQTLKEVSRAVYLDTYLPEDSGAVFLKVHKLSQQWEPMGGGLWGRTITVDDYVDSLITVNDFIWEQGAVPAHFHQGTEIMVVSHGRMEMYTHEEGELLVRTLLPSDHIVVTPHSVHGGQVLDPATRVLTIHIPALAHE